MNADIVFLLQIAGLALNAIGTLLLVFCSFPPLDVTKEGHSLSGWHSKSADPAIIAANSRKYRRHWWGSRAGLILLAVGFGMQMVAMLLPVAPSTETHAVVASSIFDSVTAAAWFQAFGTIGAIIAAFLVGRQQSNAVVQSVREQQLEKRRSIFAVAEAASEHAARIRPALERENAKLFIFEVYDPTVFGGFVDALRAVPAHEVGSSEAVTAFLLLREHFSWLRTAMDRYTTPVSKLPDFEKIFASCGDDQQSRSNAENAAESSLVQNVQTRLENVRRDYTNLEAAVGALSPIRR